jgi:hypothetical protein
VIAWTITAALAASPGEDPAALNAWLERRRREVVSDSVWVSPTEPERAATALGAQALLAALPACDPAEVARASALLAVAGWGVDPHPLDGGGTVLVVTEHSPHGGGMSAWRCGDAPEILALAPHADYDLGTDDIVRHAFTDGRLRGVMWSTVRRYRALPGEREVDPIHPGDVSHQAASLFQTWSLAALVAIPRARLVQIHGFGAGTVDADAVISSGQADHPPIPLLAPTAAVLGPEAPQIKLFGIDADVLGATTNVTARAVDGLPAPRFVHIELSPRARALLTHDPARATRLLLALGGTPWSF